MKKYRKEIRRTTLIDDPLMPGQIAVCLTEDNENGKPFTEIVDELIKTTNIEDTQLKNDLLQLRYILNVEITSEPDVDSLQDLRVGLGALDQLSIETRQKAAADAKQQIKEGMRRTHANLHIKGLFDISDFAQEFDSCNLDVSEMSIEDVEKNAIFIAQVAQRTNPTVFTVSAELANKLNDKDYKSTPLGKTLNAKILSLKNVFAPGEGLENIFVRSLSN